MLARRFDLLWLFLAGLGVAGLAAALLVQPGYMDAYYYFGGALQLARGQGLVEPYLWNYLDPVARLPHPSFLYWMPLTSLVCAPFMALAETLAGAPLSNAALFRAAQVPLVVAAAGLPLLSYAVAQLTTGVRRHAVAAALLTIFAPFYLPFWAQTDAFVLFALVAAGALLAAYAGQRRGSWPWFMVAGLGAGLAHLARADGVLVLGVVLGQALWAGARQKGRRAAVPPALVLAGYALVMGPWFARNLAVMGAPLVPGGTRMLWLQDYDELFSYPASTLTVSHYLALGWGAIVRSKWEAMQTNFGNGLALCSIVAFPFVLAGGWQFRRHPLYVAVLVYGVGLLTAMTFVFTWPGVRGGFFHSGAALLPYVFPAAAAGLDAAVEAAACRLKHWEPHKSKPVFTLLLLAFATGLTALLLARRATAPELLHPDAVYGDIGRWLDTAAAPGEGVAVNDPPGFYYYTQRPAIVIPDGGPEVLAQATKDFGARWVVLDANIPAGLKTLYAQPHAIPGFRLRQTFADGAGRPVYLFHVEN